METNALKTNTMKHMGTENVLVCVCQAHRSAATVRQFSLWGPQMVKLLETVVLMVIIRVETNAGQYQFQSI